ncbi:MAG: hypothetical protein AABX02_01905 [archaeon]
MATTFLGKRAMRRTVKATRNALIPGINSLPMIKRLSQIEAKRDAQELKKNTADGKVHALRAERVMNKRRFFFNPLRWIKAPYIAGHIFRLKRKSARHAKAVKHLEIAIREMGDAINASEHAETLRPLTREQVARKEFARRHARISTEFVDIQFDAVNSADAFIARRTVYFNSIDPGIVTELQDARNKLLATVDPEKVVLISGYFSAIQTAIKQRDRGLLNDLVTNLRGVTP